VRTGLGLADLSARAKFRMRGRGVGAFASRLVGDGAASRPGGVSRISEAGPGLACRLTAEHLLLLAASTKADAVEERLRSPGDGPDLVQIDATSALTNFLLLGHRSEELLQTLTAHDVTAESLPAGTCVETGLAGVQALLVRPVAQPALHVLVAWDLGEYVWESLLRAGKKLGIVHVGVEAVTALEGLSGSEGRSLSS